MIEFIVAGVIAILAGTTLIQIAPIKINPWSWIARAIGRAVNAEVITKVNGIEKEVQSIKQASEEHAAKACRIRILRFGDELLHDVHHSKEHFDQILLDITEYNNYCKEHPLFKNDMTVITTSIIEEIYADCVKENKFMQHIPMTKARD